MGSHEIPWTLGIGPAKSKFSDNRTYDQSFPKIIWLIFERLQNGAIMNITIKDIPEELHAILRHQAEVNGRSLNKQILFFG